jgi:hypothetical protein
MYVNDWTLDFGPRGREAVRELLARGHAAGVIPKLITPEFVGEKGTGVFYCPPAVTPRESSQD